MYFYYIRKYYHRKRNLMPAHKQLISKSQFISRFIQGYLNFYGKDDFLVCFPGFMDKTGRDSNFGKFINIFDRQNTKCALQGIFSFSCGMEKPYVVYNKLNGKYDFLDFTLSQKRTAERDHAKAIFFLDKDCIEKEYFKPIANLGNNGPDPLSALNEFLLKAGQNGLIKAFCMGSTNICSKSYFGSDQGEADIFVVMDKTLEKISKTIDEAALKFRKQCLNNGSQDDNSNIVITKLCRDESERDEDYISVLFEQDEQLMKKVRIALQ